MFLGSIGRDFEFYYDPKDFYKNLPNYGQNFKVPMSNPWRLQTNIVFHSGRLLRSDSKYLNNEENFPCLKPRCVAQNQLTNENASIFYFTMFSRFQGLPNYFFIMKPLQKSPQQYFSWNVTAQRL